MKRLRPVARQPAFAASSAPAVQARRPGLVPRVMRRLHRQPLRVKLVATLLCLLVIALTLISVASTTALRKYLLDDLDDQLDLKAVTMPNQLWGKPDPSALIGQDMILVIQGRQYIDPLIPKGDLPPLPATQEEAVKTLGEHYTVRAADGSPRWRMLTSQDSRGNIVIVGTSLNSIDKVVQSLILIDLVGGVGVLLLAASIGATIVQHTLRPLGAIERTAVAIAAGDLTRRVPDPEEGEPEARTEVGSLARSLNTMLTQIETAFTARAASETAARAAESSARDAAVDAQVSEANARRSEERMRRFVADASHELRTPLTTIRGFAELYRQGAVTEKQDIAALVKRIEDEARRMGLLVEDLLLLARMDQERPLRPTPVELRVLAVDAVQGARVVAPDRRISLEIAQDAGDLVILGDDARLRQVIGNLMSNALAHTPAGTPVELRLRREGERAVLEVADRGPGLDAQQQERVFERFYRADAARTRRADGQVSTGLGLAIVAALVAAHGGVVEVDSEEGEGATFRVRLPLTEIVEEPYDESDSGSARLTDAA